MRSQASPIDQPANTFSRALTWAVVVLILLSLPLLFNYVGRIQAESRMQAEVERSAAEIQKGETNLAQLRQALDYAKSDSYTERYAREQSRYAKPGEVVVIPVSTQDPTQPSKAWWEDFFITTPEPTSQAPGNTP